MPLAGAAWITPSNDSPLCSVRWGGSEQSMTVNPDQYSVWANAIMGSTFALRHELTALGRSFQDLDNIAVACDRGAQLTRNLLGFARKSCQRDETFSLNAAV